MATEEFAKLIQRLVAITETGLIYASSPYDKERYEDIRQEISQFLKEMPDFDLQELSQLMAPSLTYSTPLVDVRAFIVKDNRILLVKDSQTGLWALPGGFCEVGFSPIENILKEVEEETGHRASCQKLLAVFDTNRWQFQAKQYVKLVYHCELEEGNFVASHEVSDLDFFALEDLPSLSEKRITEEQLSLLWKLYNEYGTIYSD